MYKKKLNWHQIIDVRIPFEDFSCSESILRSLKRDDGEYFAFKRFDGERGMTEAGEVDRIDRADRAPVSIDREWLDRNEYRDKRWAVVPKSAFKSETESQPKTETQFEGNENMCGLTGPVGPHGERGRRVVIVELIDNDPGLDVEHSLVARYDGIVTEDSDSTTIQELIMNKDIARKVREHNAKREQQVDLDVQKRTGNTVNLQPVKLKDLTWNVK